MRIMVRVSKLVGSGYEAEFERATKTQFVTSKGRFNRKTGRKVGASLRWPDRPYLDVGECARLNALIDDV
jgi:hypothetical protein